MFHFKTIADSTIPTGSILVNNGDASTTSYSVTLNLSATDSNSGVGYMRFSNDGTNWTYWIPYSTQYAWNMADYRYGGQSGLSTYTVYAKFRDYEDNESPVYTDTITKTTGTSGQILLNGQAYETIQDAIDAANSGETVYLTEGFYSINSTVHPDHPVHPDRWFGIAMKAGVTLMGAGAEKTTISVENTAWSIVDADNSVIEGLTIISSSGTSWRYVVLLESDSSKVRNCIIKGGDTGIHVGWGSYTATDSEISNNLIINNSSPGIWLNSGSGISIYNNTIANNNAANGYGGIFGYVNPAQIVNNIIYNNYLGVNSYDITSTFRNNDVYGNSSANYNGLITDQTGSNGNISSNPSFVNSSTGDYRLNSGSPCINTGANVGIPYNGSAPDMGAYEYNGTGTVQVTSNQTNASFTVTAPTGNTYNGNGTSWSMSNLPIGIYSASFVPIADLYTPPYQVKMLYSGQTLTFDGTYIDDTYGPTGIMSVNFEEYSTANYYVTITFDITDEIAGLGGSSEMKFSNDGVTWSPAEPYSSLKKYWNLLSYGGTTESGVKTVYTQVSDELGNWTTLTDTIFYVPNRQVLEVPTQYNTIQAAIDAAVDGDMVHVLPGTYTEQITLNSGIRLQGSGAENTILNSSSTNTASNNTMIDGFTINTSTALGISSNASSIISNNTFLGYGAIGNGNGNGRLIIRNNIINVTTWGIALGNNCSSCAPLSVDIENNIVMSATHGIDLIGNQLFRSTINVRNNIFNDNGTAINDAHSDTTRQHFFPSFNIYWNNTNNFAGNISAMGPGDISSDPLFVDSANDDYHLRPTSPAANSGDPEERFNDPDGTRNDRGAYGGPTANTPPVADFIIEPQVGSTSSIFTLDGSSSYDGETRNECAKRS